jgi:hypothetical protein
LRHPLARHLQHGNFAHRIVLAAPTRIALHAAGEIDAGRLPVEAGAVQIQRDLVGIARRADAVELVVSHGIDPGFAARK